MQDRFVGDIGDYIKYSLLRVLGRGRNLGVAWYLFPNESHNRDGRYITYLNHPEKWRCYDSFVFDELKKIVEKNRSVNSLESSGILGQVRFHNMPLKAPESMRLNHQYRERSCWRKNWFMDVKKHLQSCDIIFADPDNGLYVDGKYQYQTTKFWKRLPLQEALELAQGRTAVFYHHNTRRKGGHEKEIADWISQLKMNSIALKWCRQSPRTFFIVNPDQQIKNRLMGFYKRWQEHTKLYGSFHET